MELELQDSDKGLVEIVQQASEERVATKEWRPDIIKQHVSTARLFASSETPDAFGGTQARSSHRMPLFAWVAAGPVRACDR